MKITRVITVDIGIYGLVNGVVDFANKAEKRCIAPYFWEQLRKAADTMERTYNASQTPPGEKP